MKPLKSFLYISVSLLLFLPLLAMAQGLCEDGEGNPIPCVVSVRVASGSTAIGGYIRTIYNSAVGLGVLGALVMITAGGIMYAVSGVINKKQQGKDFITGALVGLALLLGAFVILNTVNPELVSLGNPVVEGTLGLSDSFSAGDLTESQANLVLADYLCPAETLDPYPGSSIREFGKSDEDKIAVSDIVLNRFGRDDFNVVQMDMCGVLGITFGLHNATYFTYKLPYYELWNQRILDAARGFNPSPEWSPGQLDSEKTRILNQINQIRDSGIVKLQFEDVLLCSITVIKQDASGNEYSVPQRIAGVYYMATPDDLGNPIPNNLRLCPQSHNPYNAPSPFTPPTPPY